MDNLKKFCSSIVLFLLVLSNTSNAQMNGLNIEVSAHAENSGVVIENTTNKTFKLKVKVLGKTVQSASSKALLNQVDVRDAVSTMFDFYNRLSPIIQQDELFRALTPIIQQDELFSSPIIQQDELFAALLPIIQQDELFSSPIIQQDELFGFIRLLAKRSKVLNAFQTVLNEQDGVELIVELFAGERVSIKKETLDIKKQESKSIEFDLPEVDVLQVRIRQQNGNKRRNIFVFPQN